MEVTKSILFIFKEATNVHTQQVVGKFENLNLISERREKMFLHRKPSVKLFPMIQLKMYSSEHQHMAINIIYVEFIF